MRTRSAGGRGVKTLEGLKRYNVEPGIPRDIVHKGTRGMAFPNHAELDWGLILTLSRSNCFNASTTHHPGEAPKSVAGTLSHNPGSNPSAFSLTPFLPFPFL